MATNPETSHPLRNNPLCIRLKLNTQKDTQNTVEAVPGKPTTGDKGVVAKKQKVSFADETAASGNVKPWNLRNRKARGKPPHEEEGSTMNLGGEATANKKNEMAKFSVPISKKEIEEDFLTLFGKKPPRRPNKRPRNVQNDIDYISPASNLPEVVTEELYEVRGAGYFG